jgi:tetratricopeptide (TPR) repeat protein
MCLSLSQDTGHQFGIAVGLGMLGSVALIEGAGVEARKLLQESATIHREIGQREELGWALAQLGAVELALGNVPQARQHFYEALHTAADIRSFMTFLAVIAEAVPLLIVNGEKERAVELYALASRYPVLNNAQVFDDLVGQLIAVDAASLPPEVVLAAKERGRARDLEATVKELLVELEGQ